ncbi:GNAT family N-acetyltransferase [Lactovum miscens]|uniref:ElaA protein n=1 Tax=Lactovum miscens TaxID=190387 RepID=A0A841CB14_9LACT|nr:GNAT family N-acetyltransferase [Lactovum miscens]MBB5888370.1 ElaA protein [Lactovum miscens]
MAWKIKKFDEMTVDELYKILELRSEVFVVEQNCAYQDIDDKDQHSLHIFYAEEDEILAYARLMPRGTNFIDALSIGRVLVKKKARRRGMARELMELSIVRVREAFGDGLIRIHGQSYLQEFYESLGFVNKGDEFLEDGIPHRTMELQ